MKSSETPPIRRIDDCATQNSSSHHHQIPALPSLQCCPHFNACVWLEGMSMRQYRHLFATCTGTADGLVRRSDFCLILTPLRARFRGLLGDSVPARLHVIDVLGNASLLVGNRLPFPAPNRRFAAVCASPEVCRADGIPLHAASDGRDSGRSPDASCGCACFHFMTAPWATSASAGCCWPGR